MAKADTAGTQVGRSAEVTDFYEIAAFLANPALGFHTGTEVVADGDYSIFCRTSDCAKRFSLPYNAYPTETRSARSTVG